MQAWELSSPENIPNTTEEEHCPLSFSSQQGCDIRQTAELKLTHKYVEELEDSFVGQNVQDISRLWIDDWQPVDLVFK